MAKFPFQSMDYSPWSSKNLIDQNWLKKFSQVGIDVKCMNTNFGGRGYFGFGLCSIIMTWLIILLKITPVIAIIVILSNVQ